MKPLLIFILTFMMALSVDLHHVNVEALHKKTITVTVQGEVNEAGIYELPVYAVVQDALDAAGVTEEADLVSLNPNTVLADKDVVVVPRKTETEVLMVSINSGSVEALSLLPGIGEATARKIIAYREENGLFQQCEDLMKVSGIGEKKYASLKDYICL